MSRSPAVILYDGYGAPLAVLEDDAIFSDQPGILFAGKDKNGLVRFLNVTTSGTLQTAPGSLREPVGDYYASSALIRGKKVEHELVSIENPIGSGRIIYINKIEVNGVIDTRFTTAYLYRVGRTVGLPTGGTLLISQLRDTSGQAAIGIVREKPTATSAAGSIWVGSPGIFAKHGSFTNGIFKAIATFNERKEVILAEGEGIVVIAEANHKNWEHWVTIQWNEV